MFEFQPYKIKNTDINFYLKIAITKFDLHSCSGWVRNNTLLSEDLSTFNNSPFFYSLKGTCKELGSVQDC